MPETGFHASASRNWTYRDALCRRMQRTGSWLAPAAVLRVHATPDTAYLTTAAAAATLGRFNDHLTPGAMEAWPAVKTQMAKNRHWQPLAPRLKSHGLCIKEIAKLSCLRTSFQPADSSQAGTGPLPLTCAVAEAYSRLQCADPRGKTCPLRQAQISP